MKTSMVSELLGEFLNKEMPKEERKTISDVAGLAYVGKFTFVSAFYVGD